LQGFRTVYPQRDSNPCRHLERDPWAGFRHRRSGGRFTELASTLDILESAPVDALSKQFDAVCSEG